jgi:putative tryptophan/tyrosine transport system substrate-binding protein
MIDAMSGCGTKPTCPPASSRSAVEGRADQRIIELTVKFRLPAIYYFRYFVTDGGLLSYGPDEMDIFQRTAGYVDRILRGANPSDLPVQQPTKFELVINLRTAREMGIEIPAALLARADEVIE